MFLCVCMCMCLYEKERERARVIKNELNIRGIVEALKK